MILRFLVLGLAVGSAFVAVSVFERRRGRTDGTLPAGVTLVTGPDCRLCDAAARALATADPTLTVRVVDVGELGDASVRSVPTIMVADSAGDLILRRSGRSAISDVPQIVRAARGVA